MWKVYTVYGIYHKVHRAPVLNHNQSRLIAASYQWSSPVENDTIKLSTVVFYMVLVGLCDNVSHIHTSWLFRKSQKPSSCLCLASSSASALDISGFWAIHSFTPGVFWVPVYRPKGTLTLLSGRPTSCFLKFL